jgi:hypothetical protein
MCIVRAPVGHGSGAGIPSRALQRRTCRRAYFYKYLILLVFIYNHKDGKFWGL